MNTVIIFLAKYLFLIVILITLIFYLKSNREQKRQIFNLTLFSFLISFILGLLASFLIKSPRPFVSDHVQPLIAHPANNGFPSEHTLLVATITFVVWKFSKKLGILLLFFSLLVGWGRVLALVHHPVDILGSVIIALLSVWVSSRLTTFFS